MNDLWKKFGKVNTTIEGNRSWPLNKTINTIIKAFINKDFVWIHNCKEITIIHGWLLIDFEDKQLIVQTR